MPGVTVTCDNTDQFARDVFYFNMFVLQKNAVANRSRDSCVLQSFVCLLGTRTA